MPVNIDREIAEPFYRVVGAIIIKWGGVDTLITQTCKILFEDLGGHSAYKKPPHDLTTRLQFIQDCIGPNSALLPLKTQAEWICERTREVASHRTYIAHGLLTAYSPEGHVFQFTKVNKRADTTGYDQVSTNLSMAELLQIDEAVEQIMAALVQLGEALQRWGKCRP
jgi:hypothetical protein